MSDHHHGARQGLEEHEQRFSLLFHFSQRYTEHRGENDETHYIGSWHAFRHWLPLVHVICFNEGYIDIMSL